MDVERLAKDRVVDPAALDVEAARQADVFLHWAEESVKARAVVDQTKMELDLIEARLNLRCREHPEEFGLSKTTEGSISAAVTVHPDRITAMEKLNAARERSMMSDKIVEALEQKKRMIELLVTLHGQQYFAGPSVPRDLVSAFKEQQQKSEERLRERQVGKVRRRGEKKEGGNGT